MQNCVNQHSVMIYVEKLWLVTIPLFYYLHMIFYLDYNIQLRIVHQTQDYVDLLYNILFMYVILSLLSLIVSIILSNDI